MGRAKHRHLLEDPDIRRWYNNLTRGSIVTAEERLRRLGRFCQATEHTPHSLIELKRSSPDDFDRFILDFVDSSLEKGEKPAQVRNNLATIKSWLSHFGLTYDRKIKLPTSDYPDEIIPTKKEFALILRHCDPRSRAIASLMGFSGLRPQSISNYEGTDGLRLKDLPELSIEDGEVRIEKVPMKIVVRRTLSKTKHQYFSFLPKEGCQYLKEYLETRLRNGEELTSESGVIGHLRPSKLDFLRTTKLSWEVKLVIKKTGFTWRPYILRSYCGTAFDIGEARGLISHPWRQFFMGHKGDIEARYSTAKGRLPEEVIEEMRAAYERCEPLLSTVVEELDQKSLVNEAKIEALKSLAKAMGLDLIEAKVRKERDLDRDLTHDETIELFEVEMKKLREPGPDPQMIVDEEDLENHLSHGWEFVSVLPSGKILIKKTESLVR